MYRAAAAAAAVPGRVAVIFPQQWLLELMDPTSVGTHEAAPPTRSLLRLQQQTGDAIGMSKAHYMAATSPSFSQCMQDQPISPCYQSAYFSPAQIVVWFRVSIIL
jgi:hypothetical protein